MFFHSNWLGTEQQDNNFKYLTVHRFSETGKFDFNTLMNKCLVGTEQMVVSLQLHTYISAGKTEISFLKNTVKITRCTLVFLKSKNINPGSKTDSWS